MEFPFLVFAFDDFYPGGGAHDFVDACMTKSQAVERGKAARKDNYQVVMINGDGLMEILEEGVCDILEL